MIYRVYVIRDAIASRYSQLIPPPVAGGGVFMPHTEREGAKVPPDKVEAGSETRRSTRT